MGCCKFTQPFTEKVVVALPMQLPVPLAVHRCEPSIPLATLTFTGKGLAAELAKLWGARPAPSMVKLQWPLPSTWI